MRRLKIIGLVLMAAFVVGVITAASASAASTVLPLFTTLTGGTVTSGKGILSLEGNRLGCESAVGTFGAGTRLGTFSIAIKECLLKAKPCWSLGQALNSNLILVTGEWHLVSLLSNRTHYEIWGLLASTDGAGAVHIECSFASLLFLLWGDLLGLIEPTASKTFKINIETEGAGETLKQKVNEFANNSGETVKVLGLRGKIGTGPERPAFVESVENLLSTTSATTISET